MRKVVVVSLWSLLCVSSVALAFHTPLPHRHVQNMRVVTAPQMAPNRRMGTTTLFSSLENRDDENEKGRNGRNPIGMLLVLVNKIQSTWVKSFVWFTSLSKRAKIFVSAQLLGVMLVFGLCARQVAVKQNPASTAPVEVSFSQFMDLVEQKTPKLENNNNKDHCIYNVKIGSDRIGYQVLQATTDEQKKAIANLQKGLPPADNVPIPVQSAYTRKVPVSLEFVQYLRENNIPFTAASPTSTTSVLALAVRSFLLVFYVLILARMYTSTMGGGGGTGPGKLANLSELPKARFDDIQGIDDAKFEVMELVDTLRNPGKYAILGARAPKGLLLEGPPGTGKTLLARATASAAGVPLLYCSGSDFVEMYVGRGAARVRKTFARAAKYAPCLVFIDELDALGKTRDFGSGVGGMRGNDEAEQTLNQLLACMDGIDGKKQICVMAATNRKDVLDPALLRPGRFDRIVRLELPDAAGREAILRVHANNLPGFEEGKGIDEKRLGSLGVGDKVDLSAVAAVTPGLSGAELEYIVNEAAIRAVRRVSAKLREKGVDISTVAPTVNATDFEQSVRDFFTSRRKKTIAGDLLSVFK